MTTLAPSAQQSNLWWLFLLQGIAAIILGMMLITAPGATLLVMVTFLGFLWLIEGILSLVHVFIDRSIPWIWSLLTNYRFHRGDSRGETSVARGFDRSYGARDSPRSGRFDHGSVRDRGCI